MELLVWRSILIISRVRNIWILSPLVLSKWEDLALLSFYTFWGKCLFLIFEWQNLQLPYAGNYKPQLVYFSPISKDHFFVFKEVFSENSVLMYGLYSNQERLMMARVRYIKHNIIANFIIQKLKYKLTFLKKYTNWAKLNPLILTEREKAKTRCFPPRP